jgi:hypothetical protein
MRNNLSSVERVPGNSVTDFLHINRQMQVIL